MYHFIQSILASFLFILAFASCGPQDVVDSEGEAPIVLTGHIFNGSVEGGAMIFDLEDGHYAAIPGIDWSNDNPEKKFIVPTRDGQTFAEVHYDCDAGTGACITLFDTEGTILNTFFIEGELKGAMKFSIDNELLATLSRDVGSEEDYMLTIYDLQGNLVDRGVHPTICETCFDWLPERKLIYIAQNLIYKSEAEQSDGEVFTWISGSVVEPVHLTSSPDGEYAAFSLYKDETQVEVGSSTTHIVDLSHPNISQITKGAQNETQINYPFWSPDSEYIGVVLSTGDVPKLYAIPRTAYKVVLPPAENSLAIPMESLYEESLSDFDPSNDSPELSNRFALHGPGAYWLD